MGKWIDIKNAPRTALDLVRMSTRLRSMPMVNKQGSSVPSILAPLDTFTLGLLFGWSSYFAGHLLAWAWNGFEVWGATIQ